MKPSPPNKPAPNFLLKNIESSTPAELAKNPDFCTTIGVLGEISNFRIDPGKEEASVIKSRDHPQRYNDFEKLTHR